MAFTRASLSGSELTDVRSADEAGGAAPVSEVGGRAPAGPAHRVRDHGKTGAADTALRRTDLLVGGVIAAFALCFYLPYDLRASFLLDDYTMIEHFRFGTWLPTYRPTFRLEMDVTHFFFGDGPHGYYVLLGVLAAAIGVLLFAALRSFGLGVVPAAIAGTLIVAYPRADAVTLWWSSSSALALVLGLASIWMGSAWVRRSGRALAILVPALVLMTASVLCYESIFPLFLLMPCLLPLATRPRRLLVMAAMEGVTACAAALYMFTAESTARPSLPVSSYPGKAWQLVVGGLHAYPFGGTGAPSAVGLLIALGVVAAMVVVVVACGPSSFLRRLEPPERLLAAVPLLAVGAFVSLIPFVPAPTYYVPQGVGTANRVNALPQVFIVTAVGIAIWLIARLVAGWRRPTLAAGLAAAVTVVAVGAFAGTVHRDQSGYLAAARHRNSVLAEVQRLMPAAPAQGDVLFLGNFVQNVGPPGNPAYPTIQNEWDASATLQLRYGTTDFAAWTVSPTTVCGPSSLSSSLLGTTVDVPYQHAVIVDIGGSRAFRFSGQKECLADLPRLMEPV